MRSNNRAVAKLRPNHDNYVNGLKITSVFYSAAVQSNLHTCGYRFGSSRPPPLSHLNGGRGSKTANFQFAIIVMPAAGAGTRVCNFIAKHFLRPARNIIAVSSLVVQLPDLITFY